MARYHTAIIPGLLVASGLANAQDTASVTTSGTTSTLTTTTSSLVQTSIVPSVTATSVITEMADPIATMYILSYKDIPKVEFDEREAVIVATDGAVTTYRIERTSTTFTADATTTDAFTLINGPSTWALGASTDGDVMGIACMVATTSTFDCAVQTFGAGYSTSRAVQIPTKSIDWKKVEATITGGANLMGSPNGGAPIGAAENTGSRMMSVSIALAGLAGVAAFLLC